MFLLKKTYNLRYVRLQRQSLINDLQWKDFENINEDSEQGRHGVMVRIILENFRQILLPDHNTLSSLSGIPLSCHLESPREG